MSVRILQGDCRGVLGTQGNDSFDSCVTDPPYELGFMGKQWDNTGIANSVEMWTEVFRVLKPGAHLLAFGGTRTYHRMVCAIEDAGFEIRDQIGFLYGSGFPKSLNLDKLRGEKICGCEAKSERDMRPVPCAHVPTPIDAQDQRGQVLQPRMPEQGAPAAGREQLPLAQTWLGEPGVEGRRDHLQKEGELRQRAVSAGAGVGAADGEEGRLPDGAPAGDGRVVRLPADADGGRASRQPRSDAKRPAEPRTVAGQPQPQARGAWPVCGGCGKPILPKGLGTALKPAWEPIVVARKPLIGTVAANVLAHGTGALNIDGCRVAMAAKDAKRIENMGGFGKDSYVRPKTDETFMQGTPDAVAAIAHALGRWPANIIHDGSDEVLAAFPQAAGQLRPVGPSNGAKPSVNTYGDFGPREQFNPRLDSGSAARFFYTAKASSHDRNDGLHGMPEQKVHGPSGDGRVWDIPGSKSQARANHHPTVKPTELMRYLCRLVTPPGGIVLDPFMGSGSTLKAAELEGFSALGIELDPAYIEIARRRIASDMPLFADPVG